MMVVIDFDDTITDGDTIKYLSEIPYAKNSQLQPKFDYFTSVYLEAHKNQKLDLVANFEQEIEYQKRLKPVEMTSIGEIERLRIFRDITEAEVLVQARKVPIKQGFKLFVGVCANKHIPVKILSINWSVVFIRGVLSRLGLGDAEVILNDLQFVNGRCTGLFAGKYDIRTGYDKLQILQQLRSDGDMVYIGDSRTDLLSLVASDVGIIMESGSLLKKMPWDVGVKPLSAFDGKGVYKGDWNDISAFMNQRL